MKRDMELIRKVLLTIEKDHIDVVLYSLPIEGYDIKTVGYHCKILKEAGLISEYQGFYADDELQGFCVGSLTWEGNEFLGKIKDESVWGKTKETIIAKGTPFIFDAVKQVASAIVDGMIQATIKSIN